MTFKKDLGGRIDGLAEEMKKKERQKITPRLLENVGTIICNRRFGRKRYCVLQERGHRVQASNKGAEA